MSAPLSRGHGKRAGGEGRRLAAPSFLTALSGIARRRDYPELLDQPGIPRDQLVANLDHLRLMNRWLGWSAGVWDAVRPLLPPGRFASLLDIATGSGDIPRALARRARRAGRRLTCVASDASRDVLAAAARQPGPPLALVRHDATALPFRDGAFDLVICCLAAHHLAPEQLTAALAEMWRVSRRGVVVSDLERGRLAYVGARLMALVLRNPLTSHDGPISVLRAYTAPELRRLARAAGLRRVTIRRRFPFRLLLVARKESAP